MKFLRVGFYLLVFLLAAFLIESKKEDVRQVRALQVESVLSIMLEEGLPVTVFDIVVRDFERVSLYHLQACHQGDGCFYITENERNHFVPGAKVVYSKTKEKIGTLRSIQSRPSLTTGLFEVRVKLNSQITELPLVFVSHRPQRDSIVIPIESIVQTRDGSYVYVLKNNEPEKREIRVDGVSQDEVRVVEGLAPGEQIIVEGMALLSLFDRYRVVGRYQAQ